MWNSKQNRVVIFVSAFILMLLIAYAFGRDTAQLASLQQLQQLVSQKAIEKLSVSPEYLYVITHDAHYKIPLSQVNPSVIGAYPVEVMAATSTFTIFLMLLGLFLLAALSYGVWKRYRGRTPVRTSSGVGSVAASEPCRPIAAFRSDVTFKDIGGIEEVKVELEEIIDFLKNPKRYYRFGARMPRGVLLVGPPGVGKTMIAKAVAAEADAPFYYQSGASFVQIYVGMGAKRVHELFSAAKANAPSIVFIDEIDAVGKTRDGSRNDEREATLNQLLTEMDGFEDTSGVIVIAATNNMDVLDSALLRAGRFDRRIFVTLPLLKERESILEKYLQQVPHSVNVEAIARMTVGFNGAALATMVNEAALLALREQGMQVETKHFEAVRDKVLLGKKKMPVLTEEQKTFKAYYEAGKACAALHWDIPFEKVSLTSETIRPVTSSLILRHEFEHCIGVLLSGMAACELMCGEQAAYSAEDLREARMLMKEMVETYGMGSDKGGGQEAQERLFEKIYKEAQNILKTKEKLVKNLAIVLLEEERFSHDAVLRMANDLL